MSDTNAAHQTQSDTRPPGRLFRVTLLLSATLTIMAAAVIAPSLPEMSRVYSGVPAADVLVRLALTITSLTIGLTAGVVGALTDRVGRRPVLVGSLVLYAVAGTGGYAAADLAQLLVTRAVLGVAVGGIMSSVTTMITDLFDGPRRARFLGMQAAAASAGGVVFLPLAGLLADVSWRAPFWIYAVSLVVVPLALVGTRETLVRTPRADSAAVLTAPGVRGGIALILGLAAVGTLVFFMAPTQLPFYLQELGASPALVGVAVAASTASSAVAALAFSRVARRLTRAALTAASLLSLGAGWVLVGLSSSLAGVLVGVLVGGIGVGFVIPTLNLWVSELARGRRRGRVLGGLVSAIFVGQFLSPLLLQPVVSVLGIGAAFVVSGAALAVVATLLLPALRAVDARRR